MTTARQAAALFLSPKTVEYHLRHAYTKVGIHPRAELARVLSDSAAGAVTAASEEPPRDR